MIFSSIGCGPTKAALPPQAYAALEEALVEKNKAERDIRLYTNLDWTIIRPGVLRSEPATGKAMLTENVLSFGTIHRADVAALIIRALGTDKEYTRKEFSAIDASLGPLPST